MRHVCCLLLFLLAPPPAWAQVVLPGAVAPTPEGATVRPEAVAKPHRKARTLPRAASAPTAASVEVKVALPLSLVGQTLYLNGGSGQVGFEARDQALVVSRLLLPGEKLSNSREACTVEAPNPPLPTVDLGRPNGLARVQISFPACPITYDILDGAAVATSDTPACEFKEANCRVEPAGLWGPQPTALGPDKSKAIERARAHAELGMRSNFKRLLATTKDKSLIMEYAREQAGFSSAREEICRNYASEDKHGFCAARLTEARAAALRLKADLGQDEKQRRKKKHAG